jgi:hypothetical protein
MLTVTLTASVYACPASTKAVGGIVSAKHHDKTDEFQQYTPLAFLGA